VRWRGRGCGAAARRSGSVGWFGLFLFHFVDLRHRPASMIKLQLLHPTPNITMREKEGKESALLFVACNRSRLEVKSFEPATEDCLLALPI
jgi:hypothetical protein